MADNHLDDFFAKRDKKKKTGKNKKFDTAEDLAKILGKKVDERKKLEEGKSQYVHEDGLAPPAQTNEDDEWINEEEKKPDYTGLKIQELVLESDDEEDKKDQEGGEGNESTTIEGPWGKKRPPPKEILDENSSTTVPSQVDSDVNEAAEESESGTKSDTDSVKTVDAEQPNINESAASGKYVPPSRKKAQEAVVVVSGTREGSNFAPLSSSINKPSEGLVSGTDAAPVNKPAYIPPGRRPGATSSSGSVTTKPRKTTAAPNLNDEQYFPSLGGS